VKYRIEIVSIPEYDGIAQSSDRSGNLAVRRIVQVLGDPRPKDDGTVLLRVLTEEIEK
jgi:hypothetical protein